MSESWKNKHTTSVAEMSNSHVPVSPKRESVAFILNPSPAIFCSPRRYSQTCKIKLHNTVKPVILAALNFVSVVYYIIFAPLIFAFLTAELSKTLKIARDFEYL